MHFALPPRKTSFPPPYARTNARSAAGQRRQQIQYLSYAVLCILTFYLFYSWTLTITTHQNDGTIPRDSSVLIATVFDESTMNGDYMRMIRANRDDYAARHGYQTFYTNTSTYQTHLNTSPSSWSLVPALRHALTEHPTTNYVWSLSAHALITNITQSLQVHIFNPLPNLIQKDIPVVPPDSVIHTFSHLRPSSANLILTQDQDNLSPSSFILRNTLSLPHPAHKPRDMWTYFFLDAWFDPLYRAYSFQKAENHALEHIVQWHPTILAKLVIVPQRRLNSYNFQYAVTSEDGGKEKRSQDSMWKEGDLVVGLKGCETKEEGNCEREMKKYFDIWKQIVERVDGKPVDVDVGNSNNEAKEQSDADKKHG